MSLVRGEGMTNGIIYASHTNVCVAVDTFNPGPMPSDNGLEKVASPNVEPENLSLTREVQSPVL
jgi:hypothetical protein